MEKKRYYFSSYPTDYLLALLEQDSKKLTLLQANFYENSDDNNLHNNIVYLKTLVRLIRECITTRYLEENISLNKCGKMIIESSGIKQEILKDVFTRKVLEKEEFIDLEVLDNVMNMLNIENISFFF